MMFINPRALVNNRDYRFLYLGQTISFLGSMMSYVAVPYQLYQLTKSSALVGALGAVQLIPLVLAGLYGGALADKSDRRKLLLSCEIGLVLVCFGFLVNGLLAEPSVLALFALSFLSSVLVGVHRPAMEALTPQMVQAEDLASVAALGSLRYAVCAVLGPAIGGWLISNQGVAWTYGIDALTYIVSLVCLARIKSIPFATDAAKKSLDSIAEGYRYAVKDPVLVGSYLVDIIAMLFAMPAALYPAMAETYGGAHAAGWLYAALPMGAAVVSIFSGSLEKFRRYGAGVILSASFWGIFIVGLAFANQLPLAVVLLALAGASDGVSAIYRQTLWNEIIPSNLRGRLASFNMLSYMIGPLLGNARAGVVASMSSNFMSILSGGVLCFGACLLCIWAFPQFWIFTSSVKISRNLVKSDS